MHQVTVIEPKWLSEVAPTFFRVADLNKISKRKAQEKIEPLFDTDKDDWVRFGSLPPLRDSKLTLSSVSANRSVPPDHHKRLDKHFSPLHVQYGNLITHSLCITLARVDSCEVCGLVTRRSRLLLAEQYVWQLDVDLNYSVRPVCVKISHTRSLGCPEG
jgi:hypothetical protein